MSAQATAEISHPRVIEAWQHAAQFLVDRSRDLGFSWYVAYWPACPRAIIRLKSIEGRNEWERRQWRWFNGERPRIVTVIGSLWQLCALLMSAEADESTGVRFCIDAKEKHWFELSHSPDEQHYDLRTTLISTIIPLPSTHLPKWVKTRAGEFYPPGFVPQARTHWGIELCTRLPHGRLSSPGQPS
jgi:hypothetical protein